MRAVTCSVRRRFGGDDGLGTVFEIAKTADGYASAPTTLISFDGTNGAAPVGDLVADAAGNLIGTTVGGGTDGDGTVFEVPSVFNQFVTVAGTAQQGQTLTAGSDLDVTSYQWQELIGGAWYNLGGATGATYTVQQEDIGRQLRVQITDNTGFTATSTASNAVLDASGNQFVYETADQTTIGDGLHQYVFGTATNTTVDNGGEQNIYVAGTAGLTTLNTGASQVDWGLRPFYDHQWRPAICRGNGCDHHDQLGRSKRRGRRYRERHDRQHERGTGYWHGRYGEQRHARRRRHPGRLWHGGPDHRQRRRQRRTAAGFRQR